MEYSLFLLMNCISLSVMAQGPSLEQAQQFLSQKPLLFTENKGQIVDKEGNLNRDVLFSADYAGVQLYLNKSGITYEFTKVTYKDAPKEQPSSGHSIPEIENIETHSFNMKLLGASPHPAVEKLEKNTYYENFYLPHCPDGITKVGTYSKVVYKEVYPNIDWVIYSKEDKMLKYDFVVHPGGNPNDIQLHYQGMDDLTIDEAGNLLVANVLGGIQEEAPTSFQEGEEIESEFVKNGNTIRFALEAYDPQKKLTIDPVVWALYDGAGSEERTYALDVDANGNIYIVGYRENLRTAFVSSYDQNGAPNWSVGYATTQSSLTTYYDCVVAPNEYIYIAGTMGDGGYLMRFDSLGVGPNIENQPYMLEGFSCDAFLDTTATGNNNRIIFSGLTYDNNTFLNVYDDSLNLLYSDSIGQMGRSSVAVADNGAVLLAMDNGWMERFDYYAAMQSTTTQDLAPSVVSINECETDGSDFYLTGSQGGNNLFVGHFDNNLNSINTLQNNSLSAGLGCGIDAMGNIHIVGNEYLTIYEMPGYTNFTNPSHSSISGVVLEDCVPLDECTSYVAGYADSTANSMITIGGNHDGGIYDSFLAKFNGNCLASAINKVPLDEGDKTKLSQVAIYPNPNNGQFIVDLVTNYEQVRIQLTDIAGREILNQEFNNQKNIQLKVNQLSGLYLVHVYVNDLRKTFKVAVK